MVMVVMVVMVVEVNGEWRHQGSGVPRIVDQ